VRWQKEVRANALARSTETFDFIEGFMRNMGGDDHILIFELEGKFVGMAGISSKESQAETFSLPWNHGKD
jgi:L-phenylalanine/L-methionine N-acetyltransferase